MAILTFRDAATEDIAHGHSSKRARQRLPVELHKNARSKLVFLAAVSSLTDFGAFPSWRLEKLSGQRAGQYSIRINRQYRICFEWEMPDARNVEVVDYH